jgi:GNAT superfamily N-acetyltransferase
MSLFTQGRWTVTVVDDLDYEKARAISSFISTFEDRNRRTLVPEYYLWKVNRNPAGRCLLALAMDGENIVGTASITKKRVMFRNHIVEAAEIGDTFTDSDYQRQGIFVSLVNAAVEQAFASGVRLIYGTPNSNSLPGYEKKCEFARKADINLFLWVLPLRPFTVARQKSGSILAGLSKVAGFLTEQPVRLAGRWLLGRSAQSPLEFDRTFDDLSAVLEENYSFMLTKRSEDLSYRLVDNPDADRYGLIVQRDGLGELEAAIVYKDTSQSGLNVFFVADWFGSTRQAMRRVWRKALALAFEVKYDMVALWAQRSGAGIAPMLPIIPFPVARKEIIFCKRDLGSDVLKDSGPWLFSILDSDNI